MRYSPISIAALVTAVIALVIAINAKSITPQVGGDPSVARQGLIKTVNEQNVIRAGYGVFPPFTEEDVQTGAVSGVSVDIVEEIRRQIGARVEWRRMNWNTMGADLKGGTFDVVADPIFMTPKRGLEFAFTEPYSYFAIGIGVVRKGETRFGSIDDINSPDITVAVGQGTGEESFVKARAPKAELQSIPLGQDTASQMNAVLTARADIAIVNLEDARRFVGAHPDSLVMLWADNPPAYVPAGFLFRPDDRASAEFFNVALENLRSTGVLSTIASEYGSAVNLEKPEGR